jgi:hypothetical protein
LLIDASAHQIQVQVHQEPEWLSPCEEGIPDASCFAMERGEVSGTLCAYIFEVVRATDVSLALIWCAPRPPPPPHTPSQSPPPQWNLDIAGQSAYMAPEVMAELIECKVSNSRRVFLLFLAHRLARLAISASVFSLLSVGSSDGGLPDATLGAVAA